MLSISAMSSGSGRYYLELAREDYYLDGGEPEGRWLGSGARALGLEGEVVGGVALSNLLRGLAPDANSPSLVQLQSGKDHQPGWDLTFSAPKSVSILWAVAPRATRDAIRDAHHEAVAEALSFIEANFAFTRRGEGGRRRDPAGLVVASFEHGTSRALDPQLHTHALVMNVASRPDAGFGTLASRELYMGKMTAGAIYRAALAHGLRRALGLAFRRERSWFEVRGVPSAVLRAFSKRREAIERELASMQPGATPSAKSSEVAALATREAKPGAAARAPRSALFDAWRSEAVALGFTPETAGRLLSSSRASRTPDAERARQLVHAALPRALAELTATESIFTRNWLLRSLAQRLSIHGAPASALIAASDDALKAGFGGVVRLDGRRQTYSTREVLDEERALLAAVERLRADVGSHVLKPAALASAIRRYPNLNDEQRAALAVLTDSAEGGGGPAIQLMQGRAGSGKTTLLAAAAAAWRKSGYRVLGCSLSGKAAMELEQGSGIESSTLAKFLWRVNPGPASRLLHDGRQLVRAALRWKTSRFPRLRLTRKTVVVLDEAGMVGTAMFRELAEACAAKGAKLVCVGDRNQLQPIEAGGPFASLLEHYGANAELTGMVRVRDASTAKALSELVTGDAVSALSILQKAGRLVVSRSNESSLRALVDAWVSLVGAPGSGPVPLILTGTRAEAIAANRAVQARRLEAAGGEGFRLPLLSRVRSFRLPSARVPIARLIAGREDHLTDDRFHEGDRVLFIRNDTRLRVRNGDLGVIESVKLGLTAGATTVTVRLDREDRRGLLTAPVRVSFTLREYNHLTLGYAVTTHKAQGATAEGECLAWLTRAFQEAREVAYVQLSRARGGARLFVSEQEFGEDLGVLADSMARSRVKELALDVKERAEERARANAMDRGLGL